MPGDEGGGDARVRGGKPYWKYVEEVNKYPTWFGIFGAASYGATLYFYTEIYMNLNDIDDTNSNYDKLKVLSLLLLIFHVLVGIFVLLNAVFYARFTRSKWQVLFQGLCIIGPGTFNTIVVGAFLCLFAFLADYNDAAVSGKFKDLYEHSLGAFVSATVGNSIMLAQVFAIAHLYIEELFEGTAPLLKTAVGRLTF